MINTPYPLPLAQAKYNPRWLIIYANQQLPVDDITQKLGEMSGRTRTNVTTRDQTTMLRRFLKKIRHDVDYIEHVKSAWDLTDDDLIRFMDDTPFSRQQKRTESSICKEIRRLLTSGINNTQIIMIRVNRFAKENKVVCTPGHMRHSLHRIRKELGLGVPPDTLTILSTEEIAEALMMRKTATIAQVCTTFSISKNTLLRYQRKAKILETVEG